MLTQVAGGVFVHESEFIQSNAVVVAGKEGVLLVDPGITRQELAELANELRSSDRSVVAGFSTHPDWDHVLWHADLGNATRYGAPDNAASMRGLLAKPEWQQLVAGVMPPEHAYDIPMELFGEITALPDDATHVPWDGPPIRILEHRAHAEGHAALLVEERGVLVAGDMLSDILVPFLDLDADDPIADYLAALELFESVADQVRVVIPGHGSVGDAAQFRARIELDRSYLLALRDGRLPDDPRIGPSAPLDWLADIAGWQLQQLAEKNG